jgi:ribonuclease VapC
MIVDTSAIMAIWNREPEAGRVAAALAADPSPKMSAATLVELKAVLRGWTAPEDIRRLKKLFESAGIEVVPFTESQATLAGDAYRDFGKGSGHRARLNLGDCFSYALAAETGEPLLFVGDDFTCTDLTPALAAPPDGACSEARPDGGARVYTDPVTGPEMLDVRRPITSEDGACPGA